ncbi:MAG: hypothetical protein V3W41_22640 [Planctomycetota bacterium]
MNLATRTICLTLMALLMLGTVLPARVIVCLGCTCCETTDPDEAPTLGPTCRAPGCPKCRARLALEQRGLESTQQSSPKTQGCSQRAVALINGSASKCPGCLEFRHETPKLTTPASADSLELPALELQAIDSLLDASEKARVQTVEHEALRPPPPPSHSPIPLRI